MDIIYRFFNLKLFIYTYFSPLFDGFEINPFVNLGHWFSKAEYSNNLAGSVQWWQASLPPLFQCFMLCILCMYLPLNRSDWCYEWAFRHPTTCPGTWCRVRTAPLLSPPVPFTFPLTSPIVDHIPSAITLAFPIAQSVPRVRQCSFPITQSIPRVRQRSFPLPESRSDEAVPPGTTQFPAGITHSCRCHPYESPASAWPRVCE